MFSHDKPLLVKDISLRLDSLTITRHLGWAKNDPFLQYYIPCMNDKHRVQKRYCPFLTGN